MEKTIFDVIYINVRRIFSDRSANAVERSALEEICVRVSSVSCRATQSPKRQTATPKPPQPANRRAGIRGGRIISQLCFYTATLLLLFAAGQAKAQNFGVKTNVLYWATGTPNIGAEAAISRTSTINLDVAYNPWNKNVTDVVRYQKLVHLRLEGEYRYWLWEKFNGHFFGVHGLYSSYDISGRTVPFIFDNEHRYEGTAFGIGATYGFHLMLSTAFGIEAYVGLGAMRLSFEKSGCLSCLPPTEHISETFLGPTKIGISIIYLLK
ncbi:MAG: DUF3575 domain-containing protein [Tannerellaceae bacterium]|jgi:hypothetical protein|nr:DUF3575 domain-containing protein [Tannerellaceae bacterium]